MQETKKFGGARGSWRNLCKFPEKRINEIRCLKYLIKTRFFLDLEEVAYH